MSQKNFEILQELKPLETLFNQLSDEKAVLYCKQLDKFDIATIRKAVDRVAGKWDRVSFPPPAIIVAQCEIVGNEGMRGPGTASGRSPWIVMAEEIGEMVADYVKQFMAGSIAGTARAGNYDDALRKYVTQVAVIQASMIKGKKNYGYESGIVIPEGINKWSEVDRFISGFFRDCRAQADKGSIDVPISTGLIAQWREAAQRRQAAGLYQADHLAKKYGTSLANALPDPGAPVWVDDSGDYARDVMANV